MLAMPAPTPYDLRFQLLGIPVRVHPLFWLVTALLGYQADDPAATLIWVACVFISILVHEFGHGLMGRSFGNRPQIALYAMGGLCASDRERTPAQSIAVLICGPGAGFLLYGLIYLLTPAIERALPPDGTPIASRVELALYFLKYINLWWGLVNLLPIYPLDGGQITGVLLSLVDRWRGMRWTFLVGLVTAGVLAAYLLHKDEQGVGFFFVYFAFINFQMLQSSAGQAYSGSDSSDWWKR